MTSKDILKCILGFVAFFLFEASYGASIHSDSTSIEQAFIDMRVKQILELIKQNESSKDNCFN
jgi:hypothetical protein